MKAVNWTDFNAVSKFTIDTFISYYKGHRVEKIRKTYLILACLEFKEKMMTVNTKQGLSFEPLFKWPGGKRWFVRRHLSFLEYLQPFRLVEPFAGALALSFSAAPNKVLACDTNPLLINFYQQLQSQCFSLDPSFCSKEQYYSLRTRLNKAIEEKRLKTLEIAQIFWRLNRWGFNGLCRFNQAGLYNVPYGDNKSPKVRDLSSYHHLIKNWTFHLGDFEELEIKEGDFLFCDPPYDAAFQQYSGISFDFNEQQRLVSWLSLQDKPTILMNHATPRIIELYRDFGYTLISLKAPRVISCRAESRKDREEILAFKNFSWKFDGKEIQY